MGAGHDRSTEARYKAPVKTALGIAMSKLEVLVKEGVEAYADQLQAADVHDPLACDLLEAIAATVRQAVRA